jgi:hypothetical protein
VVHRHEARDRGIITPVVGVRVRPAHEQIYRPRWTNGPVISLSRGVVRSSD